MWVTKLAITLHRVDVNTEYSKVFPTSPAVAATALQVRGPSSVCNVSWKEYREGILYALVVELMLAAWRALSNLALTALPLAAPSATNALQLRP